MNNILYAILPFLLFGFISEILLKGRFSQRLNLIVYNAVFFAVTVIHLAAGFASSDNALLLSLMPVSAYLPLIVTVFVLSERNLAATLFTVFIGVVAAIIVVLLEKLFATQIFGAGGGVGGNIVRIILSLAVCALLGFVVFRFLRKIFSGGTVLDKKNWYIDLTLFFLAGLSVYSVNKTTDMAAVVLVLLCNVSVFGVIVGYLNIKDKSERLQAERECIEKQIDAERAEYRLMEQNIELGKRYRHDMRHHFSVIKGLLRGGELSEAEEYIGTLGDKLGELERKTYCRNPIVNAVLASLFGKAEECGIEVRASVNIPKELPFDGTDICAVFSNLLENAINANAFVEAGKRKISVVADYKESAKLTISVENSIDAEVALGSDGLPLVRKSENHGYGLASVRFIVEKYNGILRCESQEENFSVKAVLFAGGKVSGAKVRRSVRLRSVAIVPIVLSGLVLSLNFMPATLTALEEVPVLGKAAEIVDFRRWGFGWGDSGIRAEYPETEGEDANELTEKYLNECRGKFLWYFQRKYNGYAAADFTSEIKRNDERMLTVSMYCTINAGSSLTYQRFFTVDKATGKIVGLADLFADGADYNGILSAEIKRQIEYRVESGDFYYGYKPFTSPEDMMLAFDTLDDPNFYIDDDNRVVIVFDEGEIAPNSMGMPTFVIPEVVTAEIAAEGGLLAGGAAR